MDQWRNYRSDANTIRPQWQIVDDALVLTAKGGRDLITKEKFRHFDLRLEYTIAEGGNSGIMFRVVEDPNEKLPWRLAPEFQLFDSYNVKVRGDRSAGALYGLVAAPENTGGTMLGKRPRRLELERPSPLPASCSTWAISTPTALSSSSVMRS